MNPLVNRMAHLEGAYEQVSHRLNSIDRRLDSIDAKIDALGRAIDVKIDAKIDALAQSFDAKLDKRYLSTIGVVLASALATIATTLLHH